jgi:hypothetical protein
MKTTITKTQLFLAPMLALAFTAAAYAAAPGITGPAAFNLTAKPAFLNQPDGSAVYSWGYGCNGTPAGFAPAAITTATCIQYAGPRPHADRHRRPDGLGNPDQRSPHRSRQYLDSLSRLSGDTTGGVVGLLTQEAAPGGAR